MKRRLILVSLSTIGLAIAAIPSRAGDSTRGLDLANRWCASCHVVTPEQQRANADAPPFATIAQTATFDQKRLAYFLLDPHPKMPDLPLTRTAADDIAAYIASLRK